MIRIERFNIATHLREPRPSLRPTIRHHLRFIHQLPTKDRWVIAISNTSYRVTSGNHFIYVFTIETSRFGIRIKEKCLFFVDTKGQTIVRGIGYSGPAQILSNAARVAPPICQTDLNMEVILRCFRNYFVEMNKSFFVPLIRRETKRVVARPISKVSHWLDVVWTTLTEGPHANDLNSCERSLFQSFGH